MRRVTALLAVALPLAAADLAVKAVVPTSDWAYHPRSAAWVAACVALLVGLLALIRVPTILVPPAAGLLAAGTLGNAVSAIMNDLVVPNPLVVGGEHRLVAFNLADIWVLGGIAALVIVLSTWLIRNRDALAATSRRRRGNDDAAAEDGRAAF